MSRATIGRRLMEVGGGKGVRQYGAKRVFWKKYGFAVQITKLRYNAGLVKVGKRYSGAEVNILDA